MAGDEYPKFRAAAVQAAPVFLNREATVRKLHHVVAEAAEEGADLVVLGESFVPAFPVWNLLYAPIDQHVFFRRLFDNAVQIPSPAFNEMAAIAKKFGVFLSVGITEKSAVSMGAMWNTNLLFDRQGRLLNRHRKLVPTWAEKLTWANGDGAYLRPEETEIGRIGTLICGENTNTLARFALLAQGEQVHVATYPPVWPFHRPGTTERHYNLTEAIRLRSAAHAFEGKVFNVVAAGMLDEDAIRQISQGSREIREILENAPLPVSMILGPNGDLLAEPLVGREGMVLADIDIAQSIEYKQAHDIIGYYNRFDIFHFAMDRTPNRPIWQRRSEKDNESQLVSDVQPQSLYDEHGPDPLGD